MNRRTAIRVVFGILWIAWLAGSLASIVWLRQTVTAPRADPGYTASAVTFALCLLAGVALVWRTLERLATRSIRDLQEHSADLPQQRSDRGPTAGSLR